MKKTYTTFLILLLIVWEGYSQQGIDPKTTHSIISNGIGLGSVIAGVTSWERNKSVLLAIIHGIFSWFYVIYFVLTRKKSERKTR